MTPDQTQHILQAARLARHGLRTPGARVYDALQHVRISQTRQSPLAAGFIRHQADDIAVAICRF